jgi:CRISPR-associated protein (TIGR02584 family)
MRRRGHTTHGRDAETVLFAVTGMSPAVLTETVWALAHERPAIIPDRVVAVTTTGGRERIKAELLDGGVWADLRRTLKAGDRLEFSATGAHIVVITRGENELDDIRTPGDNAAMADFILHELRAYADEHDTRIIATIAGGRKTMSALLYACMTLVGRETDRVTHVLVDQKLEKRVPRFYFPRTAAEAKGIQLADIPFVPLRNRFQELGQMPGNFSRLVVKYSRELKRVTGAGVVLRLDDGPRVVTVDGVAVALNPRAYSTLKFLVHINQHPPLPAGQPEAVEPMKTFLGPTESKWVDDEDDIKRELNHLRDQFKKARVFWGPGLRRDSLRLPRFILKT